MPIHAGVDPNHLDQALGSLRSQTVRARLYLGIDGPIASAHESVLARYRDVVWVCVRSPHNVGITPTLNGLLRRLGDERYVFRMDADDVSHPTRFAAQVRFMDANPQVALCGTQAMDIDAEGEPLGVRRFPVAPEAVRLALTRLNPVLHPTYCTRRAVLDEGFEYRDVYLAEDLDFVMRLVLAGHSVANLDEVLLSWRQSGDSLARRRDLKRGATEVRLYSRYARKQFGRLTLRQVHSIGRLPLRLVPVPWASRIYRSTLRSRLVQ